MNQEEKGRPSTHNTPARPNNGIPLAAAAVPGAVMPASPRPAIVVVEEALKTARTELHQAGRYAAFSEALEKAWPVLERSRFVRCREDVLRLVRGAQSPYIAEFMNREKRVRSAVAAYLATHSGVLTLYDLEDFIMERERRHTHLDEVAALLGAFNDLRLGPLVAHPDVVRVGLAAEGAPPEMPQPKVNRVDVMAVLLALVQRKGHGKPITPEELQMELERKYQKPCRDLGVLVGAHLGLLIGDLLMGARIASASVRQAKDWLLEEARREVEAVMEEGLLQLQPLITQCQWQVQAELEELIKTAQDYPTGLTAGPPAVTPGAGECGSGQLAAAAKALQDHLGRLAGSSAKFLVLAGQKEGGQGNVREAAVPKQHKQVLAAWKKLTGETPELSLLEQLRSPKTNKRSAAFSTLTCQLAGVLQGALEEAAGMAAGIRRQTEAVAALGAPTGPAGVGAGVGGVGRGLPSDGAAGGGVRRPPVSWRRLRETLRDLTRGLTFRALAALERDTAEALGCSCFAELGRGESLLAALAESHELVEELTGGGQGRAAGGVGGASGVREEEVLALVALVLGSRRQGAGPEAPSHTPYDTSHAAITCSADELGAVEAALCRQYGTPCAAALGLGPVRHLISEAEASSHTPNATPSDPIAWPVLPEYGLVGGGGGSTAAVGSSVPVCEALCAAGRDLGAVAVAVLESAPLLSELTGWCGWGRVFGPQLGPLKEYLAGCPPCTWRALEAPGGSLFKVPAGQGVEGSLQLFHQRLTDMDPPGMAAALLAAVADAGGMERAPLQYLESLVEGRWAAWVENGCSGRSVGAWERPRSHPRLPLLHCCLDCLAAVPLEGLRAALARSVLLPPLESPHIVGRGWREALLAACSGAQHRAVLHQLGFELGVEEWCRDWLSVHMLAQPAVEGASHLAATPPAPPTESPAGGTDSSAAAGGVSPGEQAEGGAHRLDATDPYEAASGHEVGPLSAVAPDGREEGDEPPGCGVAQQQQEQQLVGVVGPSVAGDLETDDLAALRRQGALVVECIRHTYGKDKVFTDPDAEDTIRVNTERVGNAVEQLSAQLYSKDLHFVMELLQNAEDNSYPPDVVPCLEFVLTRVALVVLNNETGFKEADIRALSDVNKSTKKKKRGYIGKKGIGFKSVFKVSDAPEVHSNGFHVTFSRKLYGNLGMVLPSIVQPYDGIDLPSQLGLVAARTIIRLPLSVSSAALGVGGGGGTGDEEEEEAAAGAAAVVESLRTPLREVDPRLILFLKKLKCIAVTDATAAGDPTRGGEAARGARGQSGAGDLEGEEGEGCPSIQVHKMELAGGQVSLRFGPAGRLQEKRWLLVSDCFPPTVDRGDLSVAELGETEVSLAFDLDAAVEVAAAAAVSGGAASGPGGAAPPHDRRLLRPPRQEVFAYLPTRDYGLRFMVNADFIVTTSREAVDSGSTWNHMLAGRIPQLFARSLQELQRLDATLAAGREGAGPGAATSPLGPHGWLNYWLSCLPLPDEPHDLFAPLVARIAEAARAAVKLPTTCGRSLSPQRHQLRVCSDPRVRGLLKEPDMQAALHRAGLYFVSDTVAPLHGSSQLRALLNVQDFQAQDMVALMEMLLSVHTRKDPPKRHQPDEATRGEGHEGDDVPPSHPSPGSISLDLLARLLVLIFSALGAGGSSVMPGSKTGTATGRFQPAVGSWAAGGAGGSLERLWGRLRALPLLPVYGSKDWGAAGGGGQVFFLPGDGGSGVDEEEGATSYPHSDLTPLLATLGLPPDLRDLLEPMALSYSSGTGGPPAAFRFLSPQLLAQVAPGRQRQELVAGLRELGVRQMEAADVYDLAVLPLLRWYGNSAAAAGASPLPSSTLVACLALPLAAGLLGGGEEVAGLYGSSVAPALPVVGGRSGGPSWTSRSPVHQRHQLQPVGPRPGAHSGVGVAAAAGGALSELVRWAVVLTEGGGAVRSPLAGWGGGGPPGTPPPADRPRELFLPAPLCPDGVDLRRTFPEWVQQRGLAVISQEYVGAGGVPQQTWTWLFRQLGAVPFPRPRPRAVFLWPPGTTPPELQPAAQQADQVYGNDVDVHAAVLPTLALRLADSPWFQGALSPAPAAAASAGPVPPAAPLQWDAAATPPTLITGHQLPPCPPGHVYRLHDMACPSLEDLLDTLLYPQLAGTGGGGVMTRGCSGVLRDQQQRVAASLSAVAEVLHTLWGEGRYGEGMWLQAAVEVVEEGAAVRELMEGAGAARGPGGVAAEGTRPDSVQAGRLPSSFGLALTRKRWLPTTLGSTVSVPEVVPRLPRLQELFVSCPLPFLAVPTRTVPPDSPLLAALGLPGQHNPQLVLHLLKRLAQQGGDGAPSTTAGQKGSVGCAMPVAVGGDVGGSLSGPGAALQLDMEALVRVYRYLIGAASQADDGVFMEVCAAFSECSLIWLPDAPTREAEGPVPGRFHLATSVRLRDPSGVLEDLAGSEAAKGGPAGPLRVLDAHYPSKVLSLFEELRELKAASQPQPRQPAAEGGTEVTWPTYLAGVDRPHWVLRPDVPLLAAAPSLDDYLAALQRITLGDPEPTMHAMKQVRSILQLWVNLPPGGPLCQRLRLLLPPLAVFPTMAGGWCSVMGGLLLNDDQDMARLFGHRPGVHILDSAFCSSQLGGSSMGGLAAAAADSGGPGGALAPLLQLLGVQRLSKHVKVEVTFEGLKAGWAVERLVRISLQFVQRYLRAKRPTAYSAMRDRVAASLPLLKVFVVDKGSLKVHLWLHYPEGREPLPAEEPQPRAAVLQLRTSTLSAAWSSGPPAPWLFVDDVRNYHRICDELSKLFSPSGQSDRELASFLIGLILSHEQDTEPDRDSVRTAAEEYARDNGCEPLSEDEAEWEIPLGTLLPHEEGGTAGSGGAACTLPDHDPDELLAALGSPPPPCKHTEGSSQDFKPSSTGGFFNPFLAARLDGQSAPEVASGVGVGGFDSSSRGAVDPIDNMAAPVGGSGGAFGGSATGNMPQPVAAGDPGSALNTLDNVGQMAPNLSAAGILTSDDSRTSACLPAGHGSSGNAPDAIGAGAPAAVVGNQGFKSSPTDTDVHGSSSSMGLGTTHATDAGSNRPQVSGAKPRGLGQLLGVLTAGPGGVADDTDGLDMTLNTESGHGGSIAHTCVFYEDQAGSEGRQLQWHKLPDLLDVEDARSQELLKLLEESATQAAASGNAADVVAAGASNVDAARRGEALVYELLCRDPSVLSNGWEVKWVSAQQDMQLAPYDITLTRGEPTSPEVVYIEVKSSTAVNKKSFEVSTQELTKAAAAGSRYIIFRVLGIGSLDSLELLVLADPWAMCSRKELGLCLLTK